MVRDDWRFTKSQEHVDQCDEKTGGLRQQRNSHYFETDNSPVLNVHVYTIFILSDNVSVLHNIKIRISNRAV